MVTYPEVVKSILEGNDRVSLGGRPSSSSAVKIVKDMEMEKPKKTLDDAEEVRV